MPITLLATYASSVAALADSSDATYLEESHTNLVPDTLDDVPVEIVAGLSGAPVDGAIAYLVLRARARQAVSGGGASVDGDAIRWYRGALVDEADITLGSSLADFSSGPQASRPGGGAWTWEDVEALTAGIAATLGVPFSQTASIRLAELAVDVYGSEDLELGETVVVAAGGLQAVVGCGSLEAELALAGGLQAAAAAGDLELEELAVGGLQAVVGVADLTGND